MAAAEPNSPAPAATELFGIERDGGIDFLPGDAPPAGDGAERLRISIRGPTAVDAPAERLDVSAFVAWLDALVGRKFSVELFDQAGHRQEIDLARLPHVVAPPAISPEWAAFLARQTALDPPVRRPEDAPLSATEVVTTR